MKTKLENLIVLNKEELEKELNSLKAIRDNGYTYTGLKHDKEYIDIKIYCLEKIISSSKPLKPFIEDALVKGQQIGRVNEMMGENGSFKDEQNYLNKEIEW